jgi:molybdate transport system permease protein
MSDTEWKLVWFSLKMALVSLMVLFPPGLLLAWVLARKTWPGKAVVETLVSLPLVVPPVVTGLVLLQIFGKRGLIGHWLHQQLGMDVVFTWRAVVLALATMSMPLFVRACRTAFEEVDVSFEQLARTLGAGEIRVFFSITLPLAKRGVMAGALMAFARALGEFGATVLVAGNIPGRTTTLPVAIYQAVQAGEDGHAWTLAGVSVVIAFMALFASERLLPQGRR